MSRREIHNLMTIGEIAGSFGVCVATVRRWCKNGKFSRVIRTIKNQRRFDPDEVHEMLHPTRGKRIMVGYARVSSYDQRSDLTAQAERLSQYGCQPVIKDLGSGLNCKKPGLKRLLKLLLTGRVGALVVKDVITLMTVFCARLYGKRSWKNKVKENTGIKNLSFR